MVLFQHDTGYTKITKKYLRLAAVYRRFAERSHHYDFSLFPFQKKEEYAFKRRNQI